MTIILQPQVTVDIVGANTSVSNSSQKILFVGQQQPGGTITSGSLVTNILDNTEDDLFGAKAMLAAMVRSARNQNPVNQFDAIVLSDHGSGVKATASVDFTGSTATANGELKISIGSSVDYQLTISIEDTDDATAIGDALVAAIVASDNVPVTASNSSGDVTITAYNAGTLGNAIGIDITGSVAGVTVALTGMSGGTTDPVLTSIFDIIDNMRYQAVVWPYWADTSELVSELDSRFNVQNKILDGMGYTASMDTFANSLTRLNALNSKALVDIISKTTSETLYQGPDMVELLYVKASQFAAIRALRLTEGASISQYVIAVNGALDNFGGPALASKPYFNTSMPDLPLTASGRGFIDSEIEFLHDAGGTVIGNNVSGNNVIMGEVVTTYKNDAAGNPDISFKYNNYVDTMSVAREYFFNNLRARFAQSRLTTGDVIKGRDQVNALVIKAFCSKLYQDLSGPNFVAFESGEEAIVFFKANLNVIIDKAQGKATITMITPLVTQLREIFATLQIAFSPEG